MRKVALITGGTSGIGFEASKRLALQGYDLHLVYRENHNKASEAAKYLQQLNPDIQIFKEGLDLSEQDNADAFGKSIIARYKNDELKIFISCHGKMKPRLFLQKKLDSVLRLINEHLLSNIIITHHVLKKMCIQKHGRIVFVTSISAHKINQGQADYALSKGALEIFIQSMSAEYSHRNVTFNCLCLGLVNTPAWKIISDELLKTKANSIVPLDQIGDIFELFVADKSSYITGSTFLVDAGQLCRNNNIVFQKPGF